MLLDGVAAGEAGFEPGHREYGALDKRSRHRPFKAASRVRIPYALFRHAFDLIQGAPSRETEHPDHENR
jgi:hypothetical protein